MASVGQEFYGLEQLSWLSLAQGMLMGCTQAVRQGCSHLKAGLGLEDLFPRW